MVAGPGAACFTLTFSSSFQFWVGPPGGPAGCLVSGNPSGCPFNPTIYEERFLPEQAPALSVWAAAALVLLIASSALVVRSRRAVG